jgi:Fe-S-cluster containining protein
VYSMERDISYWCVKNHCGECCKRGWNIFVTENDIKRWEGRHPEILKEVISGVFDNEPRQLLTKKKQVQTANGKILDICTFYDFEKKCLIQEVKPEICKKFSCISHPVFLFRFLHKLLSLNDISKKGPKPRK